MSTRGRIAAALLAAALAACAAGCPCPEHEVFVRQDKEFADVVLPRYIQYVEADASLADPEVKAARKKTASDWMEFIRKELERVKRGR